MPSGAGATVVLLFLFTGSLVVPVKALVLGALSLAASFGALVWVFQDGHLGDLVGTEALGSLSITTPVLVLASAFGLSMDYEVFLLGRIAETYRRTRDNSLVVERGLQHTGGTVTAAAVLVVVVFAGFVAGGFSPVKQVGLGLALAVAVDASLVRLLLVPAAMSLMGRWNWWAPRPLRELCARLGLSGGAVARPSGGSGRPRPGPPVRPPGPPPRAPIGWRPTVTHGRSHAGEGRWPLSVAVTSRTCRWTSRGGAPRVRPDVPRAEGGLRPSGSRATPGDTDAGRRTLDVHRIHRRLTWTGTVPSSPSYRDWPRWASWHPPRRVPPRTAASAGGRSRNPPTPLSPARTWSPMSEPVGTPASTGP